MIDIQYQELLATVLKAEKRVTRNSVTRSVFGKQLTIDLSVGYPLLTTKKMPFKTITEELLFFLRGETDSKKLENKGINIWKGNTSREFLNSLGMHDRQEGLMGPMYGFNWRYYGSDYDEKTGTSVESSTSSFDQLAYVVNLIKTDPNSRRIIMTTYNPSTANQGVLYPCHSLVIQFYVRDNKLDMTCYNRSSDVFLGLPFNIASSALLCHIVANMTGLSPGMLYLFLGDVHLYENHTEQAKIQLERSPYTLPALRIVKNITLENIPNLTVDDFILENYNSHSRLVAEMVA